MYVFFAHIFEVSANISGMFCTKNLFSSNFFFKKTLSAGLNKQNIFIKDSIIQDLKQEKKFLFCTLHVTFEKKTTKSTYF